MNISFFKKLCKLTFWCCVAVRLEHGWMGEAKQQVFASSTWEITAGCFRHPRAVPSRSDPSVGCPWDADSHLRCSKTGLVDAGKSIKVRMYCKQDSVLNLIILLINETQWVRKEATGPITSATYSCDSQSIFVSFENGSVDVLTASNLRLRCRINPTAYLPPNPRWVMVYSF